MPSQSKPSRAIAISNHKPRKGTETGFCHFVFLLCRVLISNHKPRKGTETRPVLDASLDRPREFQTTNPARGRKLPKGIDDVSRSISLEFQTTNPARGRKLPQDNGLPCPFPFLFQTTNPARGRKLDLDHTLHLALDDDFKPQTPQGDGNFKVQSRFRRLLPPFQTTNPARGRKLEVCDFPFALRAHFKPQTPQGDGNS